MLAWIRNFFSQRTHQTRIDLALSDVAYLVSGVVQGSGVGPLMFLIYLNERITILENHGIRIKVFADDVKMYLTIVNAVDYDKLQSALDSLYSWATIYRLTSAMY